MKKRYIKPVITVCPVDMESLLTSASKSANRFTIGENDKYQLDGTIGTTDGKDFIQESKDNSLWEDDLDD